MQNKFVGLGIMWVVVIFAYIIMAAIMPAFTDIVSTANTTIQASANMSNLPGTMGVVQTAPVWIWFIPGVVGLVSTVVMLRK